MKTVKRLNIQNKPGYFFSYMVNGNDIDPDSLSIDDFTVFRDGSVIYDIVYCEENNILYIAFNNIECIF